MKAPNKEIPLLYLFVYKTLVEKFGMCNRIIPRKKILEVWRRSIHNVPRKYDYYILQEMCEYGLIEKISIQEFQLFGFDCNKKLSMNEKLKFLDSLTTKEVELIEKMAPKKFKLLGGDANKKLKKINDFFLW